MGAVSGGKPKNKAAGDAAAWVFNIVTSVGIIMVNKALMATHGFGFGKTSFVLCRSRVSPDSKNAYVVGQFNLSDRIYFFMLSWKLTWYCCFF